MPPVGESSEGNNLHSTKRELEDDEAGDDHNADDGEGPDSPSNKKIKSESDSGGEGIDIGKGDSSLAFVPPGTVGVTAINDHDVLSGRGGGTNLHPGNRQFRDLINLYRRDYLKARKNDKPAISRSIVNAIREKNGRFLKKVEKTGLWFEIGDDAAREKTSQALRQRAPEMRKLLLDHEMEGVRAQQQQMMMGMPMPPGGMVGVPPGALMMPPGMNMNMANMNMANMNMANMNMMMGMPMPPGGGGPNGNPMAFNPAMMGMNGMFNPAAMMGMPPLNFNNNNNGGMPGMPGMDGTNNNNNGGGGGGGTNQGDGSGNNGGPGDNNSNNNNNNAQTNDANGNNNNNDGGAGANNNNADNNNMNNNMNTNMNNGMMNMNAMNQAMGMNTGPMGQVPNMVGAPSPESTAVETI